MRKTRSLAFSTSYYGMCETKTWTREEIASLISSFKQFPVLWDIKNDGYKNKAKKDRCWKALAVQCSCTDQEVQRKMHNLRTQYHQELRKMEKKAQRGIDVDGRRCWPFFNQLNFLPGQRYFKEEGRASSSSAAAVGAQQLEAAASSEELQTEAEALNRTLPNPEVSTRRPNPTVSTKRKRPAEDGDSALFGKVLKVVEAPVKDRLSVFGEFVVTEIRNLKCLKNQNGLMREIQQSIIQWSQLDENMQAHAQAGDDEGH